MLQFKPHPNPLLIKNGLKLKLGITTNLFVINTFYHETCSYANQPFIGSENVNLIMAFGNLVALSIQSNI